MTPALVKKPAFWIVLLIASGLCLFAVLRYFGDAFSVLDLDVRMSRDSAIGEARRLTAERKLTDATLTEAAASFGGDAEVQTFIELEGGGKPALKPLIDSDGVAGHDDFTLYKWRVRLYSPNVEREVQVAFTPDGRPSGFYSRVPEADPGAALSVDAARAVAEAVAARDWAVDFDRYRPSSASAVTTPSKRVDHTFVYERKVDGAPSIGDGRLRVKLVVTGDRLTQLQRYVYVPEAFARRYGTLRSVNDNIAAGASVAAGVLYGLGGCLLGLIWLMRRHAVRWAPSAKWAAVVAALITGAALASISASWFDYDTATSASTHLITRVGGAVVGGVVTWLLLTVVFATAEGLDRTAFGHHPQLWRTWRAPSAYSRAIWGRTLAGYAWIGFDLAFIATFYFVVQRWLGWWSPSDALIDPNILGAPQPWLAPVSMALQAGMMEEALFRAVPLAGAALLGRRFGRETPFIGIALVLQAVIFGCAHANYPGQPAYARPVELFLPSLVWGVVYLRYGLVPGILFHFGFDLVLMSIPLFVTAAPGVGFDRAMVIGIFALPLLVIAVQRLRAGRLVDLPDSERNAAARPSVGETRAVEEAVVDAVDGAQATWSAELPGDRLAERVEPVHVAPVSRRGMAVLLLFAVVGLVGMGLRIVQPYDAPGLSIARGDAIRIAEGALADRGVTLDARWHRTAIAVGTTDPSASRFVWQEGGRDLYARLIGHALPPPHWEVRFARFDGDVVDRDTWRVSVVDDRPPPDGTRLVSHDIPEARAGKRLTEAEARPLAEAAIARWLRVPAASLRPVAAESKAQPSRVDWLFRYVDPSVAIPAGGEARVAVEIDGDEVASVGRSLFLPDAWARDQRRRNERLIIPRGLLGLAGAAFAIACLVWMVRRVVRGEASRRAAWVAALLVVSTLSIGSVLGFEATEFGFTVGEPFRNQLLRVVLQWVGVAAGGALFGALVASVGVRIASRTDDPVMLPASASASAVRWSRWAPAIAIASLVVGIGGWSTLLTSATGARVPAVEAVNASSPLLAAIVGQIGFTATAAAALIAAAVLGSRRRRDEWLAGAGIVVVAMLGRASIPDTGFTAIAASALFGLVGWWIFRSWLRGRPGVIAPTLLCVALLGECLALGRPAYPGATVTAIGALLATLAGFAIWRWLVKSDALRT